MPFPSPRDLPSPHTSLAKTGKHTWLPEEMSFDMNLEVEFKNVGRRLKVKSPGQTHVCCLSLTTERVNRSFLVELGSGTQKAHKESAKKR